MKKIILVLLVATAFSCSSSDSPTPAPTVDFYYSGANVPAPATVSFTSSATNATSYLWDFGDNGSSTSANPGHSYSAGGVYTVKLTATGAGGSTSISKTVNIVAAPTSVKITKVKITAMSFIDPSCNCSWDNNSGPDLYYRLDDNANNTISTGVTFNNAAQTDLPIYWSLANPVLVTNFAATYNIYAYDQDTNDFPSNPDDYIGGYTFSLLPYTTQGYPTTVTLQNSTSQLKIELTLLWQ